MTAQPITSITLPPFEDIQKEGTWLKETLLVWLDQEYFPEAVNGIIAKTAAQIYVRQRLEGENDLGSLLIALITEMQAFDFRKSFYSEFAIANAVSDLILERLGFEDCCGSA